MEPKDTRSARRVTEDYLGEVFPSDPTPMPWGAGSAEKGEEERERRQALREDCDDADLFRDEFCESEDEQTKSFTGGLFVLRRVNGPREFWHDTKSRIGICLHRHFPGADVHKECPYPVASFLASSSVVDLKTAATHDLLTASPDSSREEIELTLNTYWEAVPIQFAGVRAGWLLGDPLISGGESQLRADGLSYAARDPTSWNLVREQLDSYKALVAVPGDPEGLNAFRLLTFVYPTAALYEDGAIKLGEPIDLRGVELPSWYRKGHHIEGAKVAIGPRHGQRRLSRLHFGFKVWRENLRAAKRERREYRTTMRLEAQMEVSEEELLGRLKLRRMVIQIQRETVAMLHETAMMVRAWIRTVMVAFSFLGIVISALLTFYLKYFS